MKNEEEKKQACQEEVTGGEQDAETTVDEAELENEEVQNSEIAELTAKIEELEDRNLRLNADFDNFRKRSRKEKEESYLLAKLEASKELLPLLDALDRAQEQYSKLEDEAYKPLVEGMDLLVKQGQDCLGKLGIEEIICEGEQFDPNLHEAIQHVEDEQYGENEVIECLLKGYRAGDNILRHSVVRVAN